MIKFIHKKHIHKDMHIKAFVIYYSVSDIILGFLLVTLVSFFIYNYIQLSLKTITPVSNYAIETKNELINPKTSPTPARYYKK